MAKGLLKDYFNGLKKHTILFFVTFPILFPMVLYSACVLGALDIFDYFSGE